ncbi:tol-pal system protein YbgF [Aquamicrobium segne]|uniref:Cell division coordinator CpoB n=1 Tax=Aquamicrobium segne TaxID=469547 RepID=A0ABW0GVC7_9HYPH
MHLRTFLSGTLAALLLTGSAIMASANGQTAPERGGFNFKLSGVELPALSGQADMGGSYQLAQSGGMTGLEEQIRALNGKVEELNFQILQMQEQIRKQQEDNEFRLQQLEDGGEKRTDTGTGNSTAAVAGAADHNNTSGSVAGDTSGTIAGGSGADIIIDSGDGEPGKLIPGAPPRTFGTITVDKDGNVIDAGAGTQSATVAPQDQQAGSPDTQADNTQADTQIAALPQTNDPQELYRNSYQFILSGDYGTAEAGFRQLIERFPQDDNAADTHYWLGEALLGQQKYREAAETFLNAGKNYPKARKAPDMLLKLGVSLAGLQQRDVACATFAEVDKRYPDASAALKERVKQERALASC